MLPVLDELPPYPRPDDWLPPRSRERRREMNAALTAVLSIAAMVVLLVLYAWVSGTTHAAMDDAWKIEDSALVEPLTAACDEMRRSLAGLAPPRSGAPTEVAASMAAQDAAVAAMIARDRAIGPETLAGDPPALDWLADWEALLRARGDTERALLAGSAGRPVSIIVPWAEDGYPITGRMADALPACAVPGVLLGPPRPR